jgi:hypothetical protein
LPERPRLAAGFIGPSYLVSGWSSPYIARTCGGSPLTSSTSGAESCIRAANSYERMRASSRLSPGRSAACARFSVSSAASTSGSPAGFTNDPAGGNRSAIGVGLPARIVVPWCSAGKNPAPQFRGPFGANPRGSGRTTNVGRLSASLPSA